MSKVKTETKNAPAAANAGIQHVEEHAGYIAATSKLEEIGRQLQAARGQFEKLEREYSATSAAGAFPKNGIEAAAEQLVAGQLPADGRLLNLQEQMNELQKRIAVLERAVVLVRKDLEKALDEAAVELAGRFAPEAMLLERNEVLALIEAGKAAEAKIELCERIRRESALPNINSSPFDFRGGLSLTLPFRGVNPGDANALIHTRIREALAKGIIAREEVPGHWPSRE